MNKVRLAICQISTDLVLEKTLEKTEKMIVEAAEKRADFIVLPEMFACPYSSGYFHKYADLGHDSIVNWLSERAKQHRVYIVGGSVPECEGGKMYNTCFIFDRDGRVIAKHRKVHLFDSDNPKTNIHESRAFSYGNEITVFETEFGTMGCSVCFDIRFPELYRAMASRGAKLVFNPSQFNSVTSPHHWEMLVRMRATDYQIFMVCPNASPCPDIKYQSWGHSIVANPFGTVLAEAGEEEALLMCDADLDEVEEIRAAYPFTKLIRTGLYPLSY